MLQNPLTEAQIGTFAASRFLKVVKQTQVICTFDVPAAIRHSADQELSRVNHMGQLWFVQYCQIALHKIDSNQSAIYVSV